MCESVLNELSPCFSVKSREHSQKNHGRIKKNKKAYVSKVYLYILDKPVRYTVGILFYDVLKCTANRTSAQSTDKQMHAPRPAAGHLCAALHKAQSSSLK